MSLPPLPQVLFVINYMNDSYTAEQMQAYGQQCRAAALEEAAKACESAAGSIWYYHDDGRKQIGTTVCNNLATAIRSLK